MVNRVRTSSGSTSAVLWLMILLVFLPIAVGHVLARNAESPPEPDGTHQSAAPRASEPRG